MSNSGISLVLVILLAVGCFCFFYPQVENFFIFYPQASFDAVPSDWSLSCEDVYFDTEDKKRLHGWFSLSKEMHLCSFSATGMPEIFLTDLRM